MSIFLLFKKTLQDASVGSVTVCEVMSFLGKAYLIAIGHANLAICVL